MFTITKKDPNTKARTGIIHTAHGDVKTPVFNPIGTKGAIKSIAAEELRFWGAEMILANTYHLWIRPGDALIAKAGGLHKFMNWKGAIFTDSGGFQAFSLSKMVKLNDQGVAFRSDIDGSLHNLTPEISMQIQLNLGSDIAVVLDDFPGFPASEKDVIDSIERTEKWARRSKTEHDRIVAYTVNPGQKLWGITQGSTFPHLRKRSSELTRAIGFDGYAIGGVAVGEPAEEMYKAVENTVPYLEEEKPKHLLGVGTPEQIVRAVALGCDSFDCVIPTREARHAKLYVNLKPGQGNGYITININNEKFKEDFQPVDNTCNCYCCLNFTRSYIRHLFMTGEPLGIRLTTMHNLRFYLNLMDRVRTAIDTGRFEALAETYRHQQDLPE
ncbi:MAG: tRNA guanosine(34) transglycosylase Tgt [Candidatus Doudnabacteria bacterium]|nr:tRNA guanosine(34) transglycosylase Tgt [Candidatus Doudnabacteria bacterium]